MAHETSDRFAKQHILKVMLEEHCIYRLETKHALLELEPFVPESKPLPPETEPPPLEPESLPFKSEVAAPKRKVCYNLHRGIHVNINVFESREKYILVGYISEELVLFLGSRA